MIGDQKKFLNLREEKGRNAAFGDDASSKIIRRGTVRIDNGKIKVENVLYVKNLKHNLLNVSQLCDQGHTLAFDSKKCERRSVKYGRLVVTTFRTPNNIYSLDEVNGVKYYMGQIDQRWSWHRERDI